MNKNDYPKINFFEQDFVNIYNKTWTSIYEKSSFVKGKGGKVHEFLTQKKGDAVIIEQTEAVLSSFYLSYSNRNLDSFLNIDYFYSKQEENGAIRKCYDIVSGEALKEAGNEEGIAFPFFAWAEFNIYHRAGSKKRIKEILPILIKYSSYLESTYKCENGLYSVPLAATGMFNSPRENAAYLVDFNSAVALNALYIAALADILNDKDTVFNFKKSYFALKTRINSKMWDEEEGFYLDLDKDEKRLAEKTIAGFFPLIAELPNSAKAQRLVSHLHNPKTFFSENPVPSLSKDSKHFSESGNGFCGSVFPLYNFLVIKGLERYQEYELSRECATSHIYSIIEGMYPAAAEGSEERPAGDLYEAYLPDGSGKASLEGRCDWSRENYLAGTALSTIALMIESVIGLSLSLQHKTVDWTIPSLETIGIENLALKRNVISMQINKCNRGWEFKMEAEKLYYFTMNILDQAKRKTLPIPSGKCSLLIDRL